MLRGLHQAAAGMIAQERRHDMAVQNLANVNTPGYKEHTAVQRTFPEMLLQRMRGDGVDSVGVADRSVGGLPTGVFLEEGRRWLQGDVQETGLPLDVAIVAELQRDGFVFDEAGRAVDADGQVVWQPQAFFAVLNDADEVRYTRLGRFQLGAGGELLTASGARVLGTDGAPLVLDRQSEYRIAEDGQFYHLDGSLAVDADGEPLAALQLVQVDEPHLLIEEGQSLYRWDDGENPPAALAAGEQVRVMQHFLEHSNVDPTRSVTQMMAAMRAYESNQQVIRVYDQTLERTVNDVGRV